MKSPKSNEALAERKDFIMTKGDNKGNIKCDQHSLAGAVSQRACVYSGARVVLNPVKDAYHLVHGPIGCASYTWDIRGSLTSGADFFRSSFSTDLREKDIVFGGEAKLEIVIEELMEKEQYKPEVIFIYSTCVVGVIGDDLKAVARKAEEKYGVRVIPVESSGFAGTKSKGYKAACEALLNLMSDFKAESNRVDSNKKAADRKNKIKEISDRSEDYTGMNTKEKIRVLQKKLRYINSLQTGKAIDDFKNKKIKEQVEKGKYRKKLICLEIIIWQLKAG